MALLAPASGSALLLLASRAFCQSSCQKIPSHLCIRHHSVTRSATHDTAQRSSLALKQLSLPSCLLSSSSCFRLSRFVGLRSDFRTPQLQEPIRAYRNLEKVHAHSRHSTHQPVTPAGSSVDKSFSAEPHSNGFLLSNCVERRKSASSSISSTSFWSDGRIMCTQQYSTESPGCSLDSTASDGLACMEPTKGTEKLDGVRACEQQVRL